MDRMPETAEPDDDLWPIIEKGLASHGDFAVRACLAAGVPVYYREDDTPAGATIKEYPDGRRELIRVDKGGERVIKPSA